MAFAHIQAAVRASDQGLQGRLFDRRSAPAGRGAETFCVSMEESRGLNRADLQLLSRTRLREARLLLRNGEYSGAYYLSGLAVECALKACVARRTQRFDFPNKSHAIKSYSHDLERLLVAARLKNSLRFEMRRNPALDERWGIVLGWKVSCRYETIDKDSARILYEAVAPRSDGVFGWIRRHW